jgi:hypothetical protein
MGRVSREAWEERATQVYESLGRRMARRRRIRGAIGGEFARSMLASAAGTVLGGLLLALGAAALGLIQGLGYVALFFMGAVAFALAFLIVMGLLAGAGPGWFEELIRGPGPPEWRDLYELDEIGKLQGWDLAEFMAELRQQEETKLPPRKTTSP